MTTTMCPHCGEEIYIVELPTGKKIAINPAPVTAYQIVPWKNVPKNKAQPVIVRRKHSCAAARPN